MKDAGDDWEAHGIFFIRDALLFCEFEQAVVHADPGRVLRVMEYWCFAFRGAGQHDYGRECVEVLLRWEYELTDMLRNEGTRSFGMESAGVSAGDLGGQVAQGWLWRICSASKGGWHRHNRRGQ